MFNSPFGIVPWLDTIYPLAFAQNVMATSLISYKILSQYRSSAAHGVVDSSSRLSLYRVLRIIVESAMIYPLELLILIILYLKESPAQVILQAAVVPSIGASKMSPVTGASILIFAPRYRLRTHRRPSPCCAEKIHSSHLRQHDASMATTWRGHRDAAISRLLRSLAKARTGR